jgi:serine kinase of HPr protein (carbohydrate metabolism regulator)
VLIAGRSGQGKSDLTLRLVDRGHAFVSDDYTHVRRAKDELLAGPPANIAGKIEVRGIGIIDLPFVSDVPVALVIDLDHRPERMPDEVPSRLIAGIRVPLIGLQALEASAPLKVERALSLFGAES